MSNHNRLTLTRKLQQRVQSLIECCSALAKAAQDRIVHPLSKGELPDLIVANDIREATEQMQAVFAEARKAGLVGQDDFNLCELLGRIQRIIESESWTAIRAECLPAAERVLRIVHKSGQIPPFLQELYGRARRCLNELSATTPPAGTTREAWESRVLGFRDLWLLLNEPDALNDLQGEEALARLEHEFSRSLVSAITLRRLVVQPDELPSTSPLAERAPEDVVSVATLATEAPNATLTTDTPPTETRLPESSDTIDVPLTPRPQSETSAATEAPPMPPIGSLAAPITPVPTPEQAPAPPMPPIGSLAAPITPVPTPEQAPAPPMPPIGSLAAPITPVPTPEQAPAPPMPPIGSLAAPITPVPTPEKVAPVVDQVLDHDRCLEVRRLIWRMISADRMGLAYQLALCAESLSPSSQLEPSALLRAAVLGPAVRSSSGEVVECLRTSVEDLQTWLPRWQGTEEHSLASRLLVFGLSLRPTLLAPAAGALSLLTAISALDSLSPALAEIRRSVVEFGSHNLELSPGVLKGVRDHAVWQQHLVENREEARGWLDSNRQASIIYAPTTDVWHRWLYRDRPLGQAVEIIINRQVNRIEEVRQTVRYWSEHKNVEKELARTDEELRKNMARRRPIEARARTAICSRAQDFVQLAQRWIDLLASEPRSLDDFRQQRADHCRTRVQRVLSSALSEVDALTDAGGASAAMSGAVRFVRTNLEDIGHLFDPNRQESAQALPARVLLGEEMLSLADVHISEHWHPVTADGIALLQLLEAAATEPYNPQGAFAKLSRVRNHLGTQRVIDALAARPHGLELAERLQIERDDAVQHCRQALRRKLEDSRQRVEHAVCYDLITDEERARFLGGIEDSRLLLDLDAVFDFAQDHRKLDDIDQAIAEKRQQRILEVHQKLSDTTVPADRQTDLDVVRKALDRGDFLSANEYIELIRKGQPLIRTDEAPRVILTEFFPEFVRRFNAFMDPSEARNRPEPRELIDRIREGRGVGPIDMGGVPGPQAAEAAEMVTAWFRLKSRPTNSIKDLTTLLTAFGFRNVQVTFNPSKAPHWLATCQCTPLGDPNVCIIPEFGSQFKGRYRILGIYERPDEEAIINLVREAGGGRRGSEPTLVLYFGRMTEQRRRDLAELCWQRHSSFLTIDEALIFFLCGERFNRLPILFQCALPFTVAEPYTTTASLVPIEMFFGREQERRAVLDPYGTNLVYGGRQLGKSALLRDVERREHNPTQGCIVRWIDLKNRGIGIDRPAEDLWSVLGQELHEEKVLPRMATTHQTVVDRVKEWLKGADDRRILLLLDEADAFLEADSLAVNVQTRHSFPEVARLKGLMDDTNRRFKVVFAGLHNVQRAARDPNTPVAHLGTPICIGPLLDMGEWRQARDLIDIPFRHMGYDFQPGDLWMRILSYTNYYPSLVQVFCKHLLEFLHNRDRTTFDFRTSPPYPVTSQQIEEVYQSDALQGEIRHKFELTLGLDERYRLITLSIALASIEERAERALVDGFDVVWVRDQALAWWPNGFALDTSFELFRTILDEMIGLGILRRAGPDCYTLRSPNVLNLLGSKSQIEQKLIDVARLPTPPSYEAASFHRSLDADSLIRSPLTAEQEAGLIDPTNGVTILYGSQLSGQGHLHAALTVIPSQGGVRFAHSVTQLKQFTEWLREVDKSRSESEGVTLAVILPEARWSPAWVNAAVDFLRPKISSKKRFLRIVFVADPEIAWDWCEDVTPSKLGLSELSLRPWREAALRRWMEDAEFGPEAVSSCVQILDQTGGWGMLVHALGEACRGSRQNWRDEMEKIRLNWPSDLKWNCISEIPQAVLPVLSIMADWDGPIASEDVSTLAPDADVPRVLRWAERLAYVREIESDRWILDPLVRSAVKPRG